MKLLLEFDETDVDGIGLWFSEGSSSEDDVCCFVQPSQVSLQSNGYSL